MNFNEKFCAEFEKEKEENKGKIVISNEAMAISELLSELNHRLLALERKNG